MRVMWLVLFLAIQATFLAIVVLPMLLYSANNAQLFSAIVVFFMASAVADQMGRTTGRIIAEIKGKKSMFKNKDIIASLCVNHYMNTAPNECWKDD